MNFAIEVPAEANPLTLQTLQHVLQSASSSDQHQVQTGAQQLQNWEKSSGFYSSLQSLYIDYSLPVEIRYLAIIQLKNGIDKYWRKTATNAIQKEEKNLIRSRSLRSEVDEPDHRLALQISLLIAKVIRYEYPQDWPDAIDIIVGNLRLYSQSPGNSLHLSRTLLILLYIVKELSTAKLQRSRVKLQSDSPEIVKVLSTIYAEIVRSWLSRLTYGGSENQNTEVMDQSLLSLRILRRLIIVGFDFPNRQQEMRDIWNSFTVQLGEMLARAPSGGSNWSTPQQYLIEKHIIQIAKLHLDMAKTHPASFALLPDSVALAKAYWNLIRQYGETYGTHSSRLSDQKVAAHGDSDFEKIPFLEKITLKALLIIRACSKMVFNPAQTFKYQHAEDKEEKNLSKKLMRNELLTESFAREVMETLVTRFFVFTARDLREWEEEPDEWEKSQEGGGEDWEFSIRTCSEKLFIDLMLNFRELLVPPLIVVFGAVASKQYGVFGDKIRNIDTDRLTKYRHHAERLDLRCRWAGRSGLGQAPGIQFWKVSRRHFGPRGSNPTDRVQHLAPPCGHYAWPMASG